ncbi:MAG: TOMM precursor leader peptide-binding protein [Bacteroidota bacterium]
MPVSKYELSPQYVAAIFDHNVAFLIADQTAELLYEDPAAAELLTLLRHGALSFEEIMDNIAPQTDPRAIAQALAALHRDGFLLDAPEKLPPREAAYWRSLGQASEKVAQLQHTTKIGIVSLGDVSTESLRASLAEGGYTCVEAQPDLSLVVVDRYLSDDLKQLAEEFQARQHPWLLLKPNGTKPLIGPFFDQRAGAPCFHCLWQRLQLHGQDARLFRALTQGQRPIPRPSLHHPTVAALAYATAVLQLYQHLLDPTDSQLHASILELDPQQGKSRWHRLVKRPQCPQCGQPDQYNGFPAPIALAKEGALACADGGYRVVPAEETFQKFQVHISPITGIMPWVRPYHPSQSDLIYNYESGRNHALQSNSLFWMNLHARSGNGGKGKTDIQAKTGALCEAVERYCIMYHDNVFSVRSRFADLPEAIHPNACMRYSDHQFAERDAINAGNPRFYNLIPRPLGDDEVIDWTPIFNLSTGQFKYLPTCYCYAQYPEPDERNLLSYPDPNGCAAGNTLDEAILQGFLELVERDAAAIWWYNMVPRPQVDLASVPDPYLVRVREEYQRQGRRLLVLDITTDLGIPAFASVSYNVDADEDDAILFAFGAHVDPRIALERAVIEMNQLLPLGLPHDGRYLPDDPEFITWLKTARFADMAFLQPLEGEDKNFSRDYAIPERKSLPDALQTCLAATQKANLETYVLDLTQPDIGLPVARVIVPGLRHFWRRTAAGRLYDIPVKMGWRATPRKETELNPFSIFI